MAGVKRAVSYWRKVLIRRYVPPDSLAIESYLVFYFVRGRTVEIHRVIHGERNLEEIV